MDLSPSRKYISGINENRKSLVNILCKQSKGISVVHFNARSLNGDKLDYVRDIFEGSGIDVICVSETWFNPNVSDFYYEIPNYNLIRYDRTIKKGGGVAIYYRSVLKVSVLAETKNSETEFIIAEISDGVTKILVSCVYNPHRCCILDSFFDELSMFLIEYERYVICGDFNVNLLLNDSYTSKLLDHVSAAGLTVVKKLLPTRYANNSNPSLLDLVITSSLDHILKFDQMFFISDHDLIFCALDVSFNRPADSVTFMYRDLKSVNVNDLFADLSNVNWDKCWFYKTVDEKLDFLNKTLTELYDHHVPVRTVWAMNSSSPWYNNKVRSALKRRNKLYSKWRRTNTDYAWSQYKNARNKATAIIRSAKRLYFKYKLDPSLPSKDLWRNLKNLNVRGKFKSECKIDPEMLNDYFTNACKSSNSSPAQNYISNFDLKEEFQFDGVSNSEVLISVMGIKSNAIGGDGVSLKFVKLALPFILGALTHIINYCFTTSCFPTEWKKAVIIPVAKKSTATSPSDYRPISILPAFSKVCESLMAKQISSFIHKNNLLSPLQSGFRPKHSCSTAMVKILDDIRMQFDNGDLTLLCLLDFSKAFDSVNHELCCKKLKHLFGFSDSSVKLMMSYFSGRTQKVMCKAVSSKSCLVGSGVPQGSVLGPLLFSLFVNDLFSVCHYVNVHAYADDIQLYLSSRIGLVEDLCFKINSDLSAIFRWAHDNCLTLNPAKSYVLPISKSLVHVEDIPNLFVGNSALTFTNKIKNLGFVVNSVLSCSDHVNKVVSNVYNVLRRLRISAWFTPLETRRKLAITLIVPHITYSELVYSKLDSVSAHKIDVLFNNVTRYVYGLKRYDHISLWKKKILGCSIFNYLAARNCIYIFNLIEFKTPKYLYEKLRLMRSNRHQTLIVPRYSYLSSSRLFFINAVRLWNSIPDSVKDVITRSNYKRVLHDYFSSV